MEMTLLCEVSFRTVHSSHWRLIIVWRHSWHRAASPRFYLWLVRLEAGTPPRAPRTSRPITSGQPGRPPASQVSGKRSVALVPAGGLLRADSSRHPSGVGRTRISSHSWILKAMARSLPARSSFFALLCYSWHSPARPQRGILSGLAAERHFCVRLSYSFQQMPQNAAGPQQRHPLPPV